MYAYQLFGQVEWDNETRSRVLDETNENFTPWDGLVCRCVYWDKDAEIATVVYICETLEAVSKAKEHVREAREKYSALLKYFTEINGKVLDYKTFK